MNNFICPVCGAALKENPHMSNSLICKNNHCFDKAKSGYVNLLTSNHMNSKLPGDNKLMLKARHDFLEKGYYGRLREALAEECSKHLAGGILLDAGCGEGYYTVEADRRLASAGISHKTIGIDISKTAVEMAAKRSCGLGLKIDFAAASVFSLPLADASCGVLLTVFSPYCGKEFLRVLRKNGTMIMVIPAKSHLFGLKSEIYEKPYPNTVKDYALDGFTHCDKLCIEYELMLNNNEDIQNLFMMTPYFYKTSEADRQRVAKLSSLKTEISFEILVYKKS